MHDVVRRALVAALALLLSSCGAFAASAKDGYVEAVDRVSENSSQTYFDLALQFAPSLAAKPADGSALSKLPHIGGPDMSAAITNPAMGSVYRLDARHRGKPAMLLLFDFGNADDAAQSVSVLALYDMAGTPTLTDAMDVGLDRETFFQEPRRLTLSPEIDMVFLRNSHHNAGEEYLQTSLIGIWDGKFHEVDTVMSMSWNGGSAQVWTTFAFAPVKDAVAVDAAVEIRTTHCDGGCELDAEIPATIERLKVRYVWDEKARQFVRPKTAHDKIPLPDMEQ